MVMKRVLKILYLKIFQKLILNLKIVLNWKLKKKKKMKGNLH